MNKKIKLLSAIATAFLLQKNVFAASQDLADRIQENFTTTITRVIPEVHKVQVTAKSGDHLKNKALIQELFSYLTSENISDFHDLAHVIYFYSEEDGRYGTKDGGEKIIALLDKQSVPYETKKHFFQAFPLDPRVKFFSIIFNIDDFLQRSIKERCLLISFLPKKIQETPFITMLTNNIIFEIAYLDLKPDTSNPHEKQPLLKVNRVLKYLIDHENPERKNLSHDQTLEFLGQIKEMISMRPSIYGEEIINAAVANIERFKEHFENPSVSFGEWGNLWSKQAFHHEVQIKDHGGQPLILGRVLQLVFDKLLQTEDSSDYKNAFTNALSSDEPLKECGTGGFFGLLEFLNTTILVDPSEERFEETHRNYFTYVTLPRLKTDLETLLTTGVEPLSYDINMNHFFQYIKIQKELFRIEEFESKFNAIAFDLAVRAYISTYFSNFIQNGSLSYAEILAYLGSLEGIHPT